jgi:hypothetical protein
VWERRLFLCPDCAKVLQKVIADNAPAAVPEVKLPGRPGADRVREALV